MRPTEILSAEHRVIELVLAALDKMAEQAFAKGELDAGAAHDAVAFLRGFADEFHHGKEEVRLFPAMEGCGLPPDAGPTAVMRHEHEVGRAHVRKMDAAVADFEKGVPQAADRFAFEARGFVDLLRDHIAKEDQVLFPMADRMLSPPLQAKLLAEFRAFEEKQKPAGIPARFLALAESLAARYGVTAEGAKACSHACGCNPVE